MRESTTKLPEVKNYLERSLLTVLTACFLYIADSPTWATRVSAQEAVISVVGGRPATIEESGPIERIRNSDKNVYCSGTLGILENLPQHETNAHITAAHCVTGTRVDSFLNPGYLTVNPEADQSSASYSASRVIIPTVEGLPKLDLAIIITKKMIPISGNVKAVLVGNQTPIPADIPVQIEGYGRIEDDVVPSVPYIADIEIDTNPNNYCGSTNKIISVPSASHSTHGDSGGFMGYIYKNSKGETTFQQLGVTSMFCDDKDADLVSLGYESIVSPAVEEKVKDIIAEAVAHGEYADVPYTNTRAFIEETGKELTAYSESVFNITPDTSAIETVVLDHEQYDESVAVTIADFSTTQIIPDSCLQIKTDVNQSSVKFKNGKNYGFSTQLSMNTDNCTINPFTYGVSRVSQKFLLQKTVNDGTLTAPVEHQVLVTMYNPLSIDPDALSEVPQLLYSETTNKGTIQVVGSVEDENIMLSISTPQYLSHLYYRVVSDDQVGTQNVASFDSVAIEWNIEELDFSQPRTKKLIIPLPKTPTYLPLVKNEHNELKSIYELDLPFIKNN